MLVILPFLALLMASALASATTVPFMGFFIVEGLDGEPWQISIYTAFGVGLTILLNRAIARRIDNGARYRPFVLIAGCGFLTASLVMAVVPSFLALMTIGVLGFGLSGTAMASMFTFGRRYAELHDLPVDSFNAYLRATTSTAWMIGPAASFSLVHWAGTGFVFQMGVGIAALWLALVFLLMPANVRPQPKKASPPDSDSAVTDRALWLAAIVCFFFAFAHVLASAALPVFLVREAGLPSYAPGLSFSIKTAVEIAVILFTPHLMRRFPARGLLMITALLAIVAFVVLANVASLPMLVVGAALEGFYYGLFAGISVTFVQNFAGQRMANATSFYVNALLVGGLLAGPAVGLIAQVASFRVSILLAIVGAVLAFGALAVMRSMIGPEKEPEPRQSATG